jgi:ribosomal protein S18 acetylase RimI-like enzyme
LLSEASLKVRRAEINDLDQLVEFTAAEAREAEGQEKDTKILRDGIKAALEDRSIAMYWVLMNQNNEPVGSASVLKEWSDWSAGYYWWIQSMYIKPDYRGKGYMDLLLNAIKSEMKGQAGLELRLYVHEDNQVAIKAYKKSNFTFSKYRIMIQK